MKSKKWQIYIYLQHCSCFLSSCSTYGGTVSVYSPHSRRSTVFSRLVEKAPGLQAERSGFPPHYRTLVITLNHPPTSSSSFPHWPPLASADLENIWQVRAGAYGAGAFRLPPKKLQKYWANYKIIIWWRWQGHAVGVFLCLPGLSAGRRKMK